MSDYCSYWLAVKALRDEIKTGGENEVYKLPAHRIAVDKQYLLLTKALLDRILNDWRHREQHGLK